MGPAIKACRHYEDVIVRSVSPVVVALCNKRICDKSAIRGYGGLSFMHVTFRTGARKRAWVGVKP